MLDNHLSYSVQDAAEMHTDKATSRATFLFGKCFMAHPSLVHVTQKRDETVTSAVYTTGQ